MFKPEIFKEYDIRGVFGTDFDANFAYHLGRALVQTLEAKSFIIGQDARESSAQLAGQLMRGINSVGGTVTYISLVSIPLYNHMFEVGSYEGGVMITASHNGPEYAGFKIQSRKHGMIDSRNGLALVRDAIERDQRTPENALQENVRSSKVINFLSRFVGHAKVADTDRLLHQYVDSLIALADLKKDELRGMRIKVSGPASIMREFHYLSKKVGLHSVHDNYVASFEFDGDADRIKVRTAAGQLVRSDYVVALFVQQMVKFWKKPVVVHDLRFSRGVTTRFKAWRVRSNRSRVGRTNVRLLMQQQSADIGGELSGHIFFKETHCNESPLIALLYILRLLKRTGSTLETLTKQFMTWYPSPEIALPFSHGTEAMARVIARLKEKYPDGVTDDLDGLTIEYPDWWLNVRPSHTEPILRLVAEAKTKEIVQHKLLEIEQVIKSAVAN